MSSRSLRHLVGLVAGALIAATLASGALVDAGSASAATTTAAAAAPAPAPAAPRPRFRLADGVTFNQPFRRDKREAIMNYQIAAINHVRAGFTIRIATWNFDSPRLHDALIRAHKRGVSVKVIMSRGLAMNQGPGRSYQILKAALAGSGNQRRTPALRSWIRTCRGSCRGSGGAAHSKFMLINQTGATKWMVSQGSANFTGAAAYNQFNDWTTNVDDKALYDGWVRVFSQATRDRSVPAVRFRVGDVTSAFAPFRTQPDPVLHSLRYVKCTGSTVSSSGRTFIRVANAVWGDDRGVRIAKRLRELYRQGCDMRVTFMMMSPPIRKIFAGMPVRQMIYVVGDEVNKFEDQYVHLKAMSIIGNVDGRTDGRVVLSSSDNWSNLSLRSDEQVIVIRNRATLAKQYKDWITNIYKLAPRSLKNYIPTQNPNVRAVPVEPGRKPVLTERDYDFHQLEAELD